jgi:hypothetical protein
MAGMISARFRNDSSFAISGFALFVITEDSIYFPAPNFDSIHNHVARDFLPDHIGVPVSILPGDSALVNQPFAIQSGWNIDHCRILAWLQDTVMLPDSTKNIYQSSMTDIADLTVDEESALESPVRGIKALPNPVVGRLRLVFDVPLSVPFTVTLFDIAGRRVRETGDVGSEGAESIDLDLRNVRSGVYFYSLRCAAFLATGKFVRR